VINRSLSTVALWSVLIGAIYFWKLPALACIATVFSLIAQNELYNMSKQLGWKAYRVFGLVIGGSFLLATAWHELLQEMTGGVVDDTVVLAIGCILGSLFGIRNRQIKDNFQRFGGTMIGLLLIPFMMSFYIRIAQLFPGDLVGPMTSLWVVGVAKFSDVGAFLAGSILGRNKMAPEISPSKTWEGLIGGIFLGCLMGYLAVLGFPGYFPANFQPWMAACCSVPIAAMAAFSDLFESVIKRQAGVKDSGKCIPGIGGAFDLLDSMLLSAPVAFILLSFFTSP